MWKFLVGALEEVVLRWSLAGRFHVYHSLRWLALVESPLLATAAAAGSDTALETALVRGGLLVESKVPLLPLERLGQLRSPLESSLLPLEIPPLRVLLRRWFVGLFKKALKGSKIQILQSQDSAVVGL